MPTGMGVPLQQVRPVQQGFWLAQLPWALEHWPPVLPPVLPPVPAVPPVPPLAPPVPPPRGRGSGWLVVDVTPLSRAVRCSSHLVMSALG
jgi:hypothetical protein